LRFLGSHVDARLCGVRRRQSVRAFVFRPVVRSHRASSHDVAGNAAAVVSTILFFAADSTPRLVAGRIVSGFATGIASGTCTAWLAELYPGADKSDASLVASGANFIGLAAGALTAGLLAQYAAKPLALRSAARCCLSSVQSR